MFSRMGPNRIQVLESAVGESGYRARCDVDYFYAKFRAFEILEDDVFSVGRPVRFQVVHGFRAVRRNLLRVVPLAIDNPDAPRARPGSIHGKQLSVRRERRIERIVEKFLFLAGGEILFPDVAAIILAEYVTRLQFAARLIGAKEQDALAFGRPLWLDVVSGPRSQLLRFSLKRFDEYFLETVHFTAVGKAFFAGRPGREFVKTFCGGELNELSCGKRIGRVSTESFAEKVAGEKHSQDHANRPPRFPAANRWLCSGGHSGCRAGFELAPQALEIGIHFRSALAAQLATLFQSLADDFFQLRGESAPHMPGQRRGLIEYSVEDGGRSGALEWQGSGGHLVEHDTEGEQVCAGIEFLAEGLLGRHVRHSAQCRARAGVLAGVRARHGDALASLRGNPGRNQLGQAEIENLGVAAGGNEDVGRLDVPVNDSFGVSGVESIVDLAGQIQQAFQFHGAAAYDWLQPCPLQNPHANESLSSRFPPPP